MGADITSDLIEKSMVNGLMNFLLKEYGTYIEISGAHEDHIKFFSHEMGLIVENNNPFPVTIYYEDKPIFHIDPEGVGLMDCDSTEININEFEVRIENAFCIEDVFFHFHNQQVVYMTNNRDDIASVLYQGVKLVELKPHSKQRVVIEGAIFRDYLDIVV